MHDLLEKNYQTAQPDPAFEQRMVSGIRRKIQNEENRETAWESLLALWSGVKGFVACKREPIPYLGSAIALMVIVFVLAGVALGPITNGIKQAKGSAAMQAARMQAQQAEADQGQRNGVFSTITSQLATANSSH